MEKTPIYEFKVPVQISRVISEAKVVCLEVLDSILNDVCDFHFLEPLVSFKDVLKVKPMLAAAKPPPAEALALMSRASNDKKKAVSQVAPTHASSNKSGDQPKVGLTGKDQPPIAPNPSDDEYVRPKLNLALKLEVSQTPLAQRSHVLNVAEVLEEILTLLDDKDGVVSSEETIHLPPRLHKAPGKTLNEARKQKEEEAKKEAESRARGEETRKKRKEELKKELVRLKE